MQTIERYLAVRDFPELPSALRGYAGFDGFIAREGKAWPPVAKAIRQKNSRRAGDNNQPALRGVYLSTNIERSAPSSSFVLAGYEAGWYRDAYSHYSIVLHHLAVREGTARLNGHLLFDQPGKAMALTEEWLAWHPVNAGDKETMLDDEVVQVFAVFHASRLSSPTLQ